MKKNLLILLLLLFTFSCKTTLNSLQIDKNFNSRSENTLGYKITGHQLNGDQLKLYVEYTGKCKNHEFELKSKGMFLKSNPPKLPLYLTHTYNAKQCDDVVSDSIQFDVSSIKNINKSTKTVILTVSGYITPITYSY